MQSGLVPHADKTPVVSGKQALQAADLPFTDSSPTESRVCIDLFHLPRDPFRRCTAAEHIKVEEKRLGVREKESV